MVNTNIQHKIKLLGPGLKNKPNGNYEPGEYKKLTNLDLIDGVARTRRSILPAGSQVTAPLRGYEITDPLGFVGVTGDMVIATSLDEQVSFSENDSKTLWAPSNLPVGVGETHAIVGYFEYNKVSYWLTDKVDATGNHTYSLYYGNSYDTTFAGLSSIELYSELGATFRSFFIFKDRLFIITATGIRFSKATDPKIYTVPDGGFFSIPNESITSAAAIRDSIYVGTTKGIHVFTYSIDPNSDGYLRPIYEGAEIQSMCVHADVPYATSSYNLSQINNQTVTKIMDYEDIAPEDRDNTNIKLASFQDTIFIIRRTLEKINTNDIWAPGVVLNEANDYGNQRVFSLNTESVNVNSISFNDCFDLTNAFRGGIVDTVVPVEAGNPTVYFLTARPVGTSYESRIYYLDYPRNDTENLSGIDRVFTSTGIEELIKVKQEMEIDSVVPDGSEYQMKKFRNLMGMAVLPTVDFEFAVAYDNQPEVAQVDLVGTQVVRPHSPFRIGLNQRGRSVTFKFRTKNAMDPMLISDTHLFELSDLDLLWSYTQRAPESRSV